MIKERYCSYEVSKLLKEKGFDAPCSKAYMNDSMVTKSSAQLIDFNSNGYVSKPTHQMAMDWLRETHKLHIAIERGPQGYHIIIETIPFGVVKYITREIVGTTYVESFKDAVDAALEFCLTKLIKGGGK